MASALSWISLTSPFRREQMKTLPVKTPTWLKLYDVLVQLETEIDAVLPEFQALVLGLQSVWDCSSLKQVTDPERDMQKRDIGRELGTSVNFPSEESPESAAQ